jgi:hypothetical protein
LFPDVVNKLGELSGDDVMILKIFSPKKNWKKYWRF